jgi:ATP/maltotriose-dependent transcriptional regulator MalT
LGDVALLQGDNTRATVLYWEALALLQNAGDRWYSIWPLHNLGWLALAQGDKGRVRTFLEDIVGWCRDKRSEGLRFLLHLLGALVSTQGDMTRATTLLREALTLQRQFEPDLVKESLDVFAWMAARQGKPAQAARWLGATEPMLTEGFPPWRSMHEKIMIIVRSQFDEATFAAAWAAGQALTVEQAIAEALDC